MQKRPFLILGCVASMFACGDLGDVEDRPVLAVIEGQLSTQAVSGEPAPANVRVAIVWKTSTNGFRSAADVAVSPVFPSKYRLELSAPPPAEATTSSEAREPDPTTDNPGIARQARPASGANGSASFAVGSIVAYEDRNGNGQLDLVDGDESIDRVIGTNKDLVVVWLEGGPPAIDPFSASSAPVKGYNLLRGSTCNVRRGQNPPAACDPAAWLPITTAYDMAVSDEPELAELACRNATTSDEASPTRRNIQPGETPPAAPGPNGWPAKDDANLVCADDGKTYSYFECTSTSAGVCRGIHERCTENVFGLPSATPPAEWPCGS